MRMGAVDVGGGEASNQARFCLAVCAENSPECHTPLLRSGLAVGAALTALRHRSEEIAQPLHPVEYEVGGEGAWIDPACFDFLPTQWRGNDRARTAPAQGVGRSGVAADTVLCMIDGDLLAAMRCPMGDSHQRRTGGGQTLCNGLH